MDEYAINQRGGNDVLCRWDGQKWQALAWAEETDGEWYVSDGDRQILIGDRGDAVDHLWNNRQTGGIE